LSRPHRVLHSFPTRRSSDLGAQAGPSMLPTTPPTITQQGTILGTFQYMAPEQVEGFEADARTDIFAFGALLFEMITGQKAFEGRSEEHTSELQSLRHLVCSL